MNWYTILYVTYWEFEVNKLGDDKFRSKVKVINVLSNKINDLKKRKKNLWKKKKNKKIDNLGTLQKWKTLNIKTLLLKRKIHFTSEEDTMLKDTEKILYDYLNKECLLCGKEMISSTQIDFGDENELRNFALQTKAELEEEFKYRKIYCIDTLIYSIGLGLLGVKASILR